MVRKRSRQVRSKQSIFGDQSNNNNNQWIPLEKPSKPPSSFFFTSPKFFKGFFTLNEKSDAMLSPTSILDKNPFSVVANLWGFDNTKISSKTNKENTQKQHQNHAWEQPNNKLGISLALIDETHESNSSNNINNFNNNAIENKQQKRKLVVFGSQLRIQVPPLPNSSVFPCFSPKSPREFGLKTPRNNLWSFGSNDLNSQVHPDEESLNGNGFGSIREIDEDSEDYTCVISHGPNPKTTHIFGNCIVESCCGKIVGSPSFSSKRNGYFGNSISSQVNSLSFCHHCKKNLGQGRDIYMYRGEKGFCSKECRCQGMLYDRGESYGA